MTSDQLQDVGGLPVLSASARYTLPADTCVGKLVPVPGQPVLLAPAPPIALSGSGRYVALGDSYAAGEGLAPYITGTKDTSQGGDPVWGTRKPSHRSSGERPQPRTTRTTPTTG